MTDTAPPSPQAVMMQLVNGQLVSRAIGVVAELGIADRLADGPRTSAELAEATATNPDALYRVLRMLAGLEVFGVRPDRRVENTSLSDTLRSDTPGSVRHYARWFGTSLHWRAVGDLDHSVGTGEPSLVKDQPDKNAFEVLAADPTAQATFNDAMTGLSSADAQAIAGAYDFARFGRIVDVGGDHAALAQGIAAVAPDAQITVFDLPHVIEGTDHRLAETTGGDRITTRTGSFFDGVPGAFDLCVMKHIIHDWDDCPGVDHPDQLPERARGRWSRGRLRDGRVGRAGRIAGAGHGHRDAARTRRAGAHAGGIRSAVRDGGATTRTGHRDTDCDQAAGSQTGMRATPLACLVAIVGVLSTLPSLHAQATIPTRAFEAGALPETIPIFPLEDVMLFPGATRRCTSSSSVTATWWPTPWRGTGSSGWCSFNRATKRVRGTTADLPDRVRRHHRRRRGAAGRTLQYPAAGTDQVPHHRRRPEPLLPAGPRGGATGRADRRGTGGACRPTRGTVGAASVRHARSPGAGRFAGRGLVNSVAQIMPLDPLDRLGLLEQPGPLARARAILGLLYIRSALPR